MYVRVQSRMSKRNCWGFLSKWIWISKTWNSFLGSLTMRGNAKISGIFYINYSAEMGGGGETVWLKLLILQAKISIYSLDHIRGMASHSLTIMLWLVLLGLSRNGSGLSALVCITPLSTPVDHFALSLAVWRGWGYFCIQ